MNASVFAGYDGASRERKWLQLHVNQERFTLATDSKVEELRKNGAIIEYPSTLKDTTVVTPSAPCSQIAYMEITVRSLEIYN